MWILMNDAMLSIVQHTGRPDDLLVRARLSGDIERVFPCAEVVEGAGTDYRFRAAVSRREVADVLNRRLMEIDYGNFKDSVREPHRHDAYLEVWHSMYRMQQKNQRHQP